jgi:hypothetical protein
MCSQVIDRSKMVFMPKNIANLVMNITCVLGDTPRVAAGISMKFEDAI